MSLADTQFPEIPNEQIVAAHLVLDDLVDKVRHGVEPTMNSVWDLVCHTIPSEQAKEVVLAAAILKIGTKGIT